MSEPTPPPFDPSSPPPGPPPGAVGHGLYGAPAGGSTGSGARGPSAAPPTGRLLPAAGMLAVVAAVLIYLFVVRGGSDGLNPVAEAAEATARMPGAKVAMEVTYTFGTGSSKVVAHGGGAYNARTGFTKLDLSVPTSGGGTVKVDTVGDAKVVYLRSPKFAAELPAGKEWLGMEPLLGHDPQTALGSNGGAGSMLDGLKAVGGDVEKLDHETVRGHLTTRYKATIELSRVAAVFAEDGETALAHLYEQFAERAPEPIQVEAWVDEKGLAREVREVEQIPIPGGPTMTMDMRMQFYAFGSKPKIKLPPKRKVFDMTPILRRELGMDTGPAGRSA